METTKNKAAATNDLTSTMIVFKADEKKYCFETNRENVTVVGSTGNHDHGSSKVKLKSIVNYQWEERNYPGRLIAVHIDGKHIAYAIKVNNKEGRIEGMVRVVNQSNSQRALIKGLSGEVFDLQFAHIRNLILLACIEEGALHIHRIDAVSGKIQCTPYLKIEDLSRNMDVAIPIHRISWCPYVPEKETDVDEFVSQQLVWIRGSTFRCYSVRAVVNMYGLGSRLNVSSVEGTQSNTESANVTEASFSPDGTTLCISCEDGVIRFYQIYFHTADPNPRCLHQWIPHGGKSISSFFFLDNLTKHSKDKSLWRHAITTCDNNTELKVWCCATWECLQTVRFAPQPGGTELKFKVQIDRTASYIVLSDHVNRGLYVLQVQVDMGGSPPRNHAEHLCKRVAGKINYNDSAAATTDKGDESSSMDPSTTKSTITEKATTNSPKVSGNSVIRSSAYIKSISEFPLSSPILSFGIVDAAVRKYKCAFNDSYLIEELDDYDEENNLLYCVVIHMFLVQPKSVLECHVLYQPTVSSETDVHSSIEESTAPALISTSSSTGGSAASLPAAETVVNTNKRSTPVTPAAPVASAEEARPLLVAEPPLTLEGLMSTTTFKKIENHLPGKMQVPQASSAQPSVAVVAPKVASAINLMTPDSFQSPGRVTPEGVSSEVRSTLRMLAQAQSPADLKRKSAETANLLNLVSSQIIDEQEQKQQMLRQSVELKNQILAPASGASLLAAAAAAANAASGGSSPSREVQEILSLKDSDFIYDESSELDSDIEIESDIEKNNDGGQYNFNEANLATTEVNEATTGNTDPSTITNNSKGKIGDWPKVPQVPTGISNMHSATFNNINSNASTTTNANSFNEISCKMDQVLEFLQTQSCQIAELRRDVADAQKAKLDDAQRMDKLAKSVEFNLGKMNEDFLKRCERDHHKRLEAFVSARELANREFRDHIVHSVTQLVCSQLTERLSQIMLTEVQRHIVPTVASKLDAIKAQIQLDVAQKLTSSDQLLRDNIAKICTNKNTMEVFGNSVVNGVHAGLQLAFSQSVKVSLVPAYEKASHEMFKQIQEAFINGTKSYSKLFDNFYSQYEPIREQMSHLASTVPEQLKASSEATLTSFSTQLSHDVQRELKTMQLHLLQTVRDNVKAEIRKGFESQASAIEDSVMSAVRSQAQTPAPSIYDVQEQIKNLLGQGLVNSAFHQALVANDLQLVEFTIEKADYATVFSNPCPLQQTVLLSLIQQISADMSNHNELKQRYLADAILNLNLRDPITKDHAPKVMRELYQHCQKFAAANPGSSHISGVRMLMMAVQGLGVTLF